MIETPGLMWTILFFVVALAPLVFVHELGHYLVGRWCGIKADVFSIGFGRKVFGWTDKRGTEWKIGWLPLGGYVKFAGDMSPVSEPNEEWKALPQEERDQTFQSKPLWKRAATVAAGPITNFLFAIVIFMGFALAYGKTVTPPIIAAIDPKLPAASSGLQVGDRIISVNGRETKTFQQVQNMVVDRPLSELDLRVDRKGQAVAIKVKTALLREKDRFGNEFKLGRLGVTVSQIDIEPVSLFEAPGYAVGQVVDIIDRSLTGLGQIITGRRSIDELGGPLKIAQISGQVATLGILSFVSFLAFMSINLGFINLLPIPMLDGGHLTFYALEAIMRKPVSPRIMELAYRSGMALVLGLMLFVTLNDLGSFGLWRSIAGLFG